jgi:hypothetical protein
VTCGFALKTSSSFPQGIFLQRSCLGGLKEKVSTRLPEAVSTVAVTTKDQHIVSSGAFHDHCSLCLPWKGSSLSRTSPSENDDAQLKNVFLSAFAKKATFVQRFPGRLVDAASQAFKVGQDMGNRPNLHHLSFLYFHKQASFDYTAYACSLS